LQRNKLGFASLTARVAVLLQRALHNFVSRSAD
jgi:hypothetical protein